MRIGINCRSFCKKKYTGIGRYAHNLVRSLATLDFENEYWLYGRKGLFDFKRTLPRINGKKFILKNDLFKKGIPAVLKGVDLYHSPSPDALPSSFGKTIVTVHDLIYKTFPDGHTPETCETTDKHMQCIVRQADKVICCSESTKNDLRNFFSIKDEDVSVIYPGTDQKMFYPLAEQEEDQAKEWMLSKGVEKPFLLYVGTIEPRKNLKTLLEAFASLKKTKKYRGCLVVVGMKGWMMEDVDPLIQSLGIKNNVLFLGYVSDQELRSLYHQTDAFIFPSFYEGFGFPIVEAFCCGAAVITSDVSSCPEVAGDGALIVDPHSADEMAEAILRIIEDKTLRQSLKEKALNRSKNFLFENTARMTLDVYREVGKR